MRLFSFVVTYCTLYSLSCIKIWYGINVTLSSVVTGYVYLRSVCASENRRFFATDLIFVLCFMKDIVPYIMEVVQRVVLTALDKK